MKHSHYCTDCGNPVLCPAYQNDGDCPDAFLEMVEDMCRDCWEGKYSSSSANFEQPEI